MDTTSTKIPTLAELAARNLKNIENAKVKFPNLTLNPTTYMVGKSGSTYAGSTGEKLHVIMTGSTVTASGKTITTIESPCNSTDRRQAAFNTIEGLDTDHVTCTKCCKWLAKVAKNMAAGK